MHQKRSISLGLFVAALFPVAGIAAIRHQSYEELAASADKIMLGTVGTKTSYWGNDSKIYTDVVVYPDLTVKGAEDGAVTVRVLGGTVGDTKMSVSDGPEFPDGEHVVVFLRRENGRFTVVGRSDGTVAAASALASVALDGAFNQVERSGGAAASFKRGLATSYLKTATARSSNGKLSQAAAQVGCYSSAGTKWGTNSATYSIDGSVPSSWVPSINAATATWNSAGAAFQLINDGNSANAVSYLDLVAKYGSSYSNTYAVTTTWTYNSNGAIAKATTEVNTKWQWSTAGEPNMADIQNIMTHELGHWMQLLDIYSPSDCSYVTMWGTAVLGETSKRTLEQPDIDGFIGLYGPASSALSAPMLTSPANGTSNVSSTPVLTWTATQNATSYDVYLGTSASPALVATVTGTSYQPGTLAAGATYYWKVVAKNGTSNAPSSTFSFTVSAPTSSGIVLLTPANGATGVATTTSMQWTAVPGATTYDLYIGTSPWVSRIGSVNATSVTVSGFQPGTTYYWQVVARTRTGTVSSTQAWFLTN